MSGKLVLDEIDVNIVNIDTLTVSQSNLWTTQTYEFKHMADNVAELSSKIEALSADINSLKSSKENSFEGFEDKIKEEFIEYMMEHFNIKWLDDSIERDAYETILSVLFKLLNKVV